MSIGNQDIIKKYDIQCNKPGIFHFLHYYFTFRIFASSSI